MFFFFFKQKTAYEMRISDWSSAVCSSGLLAAGGLVGHADLDLVHLRTLHVAQSRRARVGVVHVRHQVADLLDVLDAVEALQQVDHRADGVVAAGQADAEQGHLRSLRVWGAGRLVRSEEHTSELQSLMRISYAVFCLKT